MSRLTARKFLTFGRFFRNRRNGISHLHYVVRCTVQVCRFGRAACGPDGQVAGDLIIGCSTTSGKYLLPGLVAAFRRDFPLVRVRIKVMSRDDVINRLLDNRLALGVTSPRLEHPDLDYIPLFEDRVILIVPANHPWAAYGSGLPADLVDEPMIVREDKAGTSQVLAESLARQNMTTDMLNVVMEIGNAEAIEMAVEAGIDLRRAIFMVRNTRQPLTHTQDRFWFHL